MSEEPLTGGWQTSVHRDGDIVRRSSGPQSASVIELLKHLANVGFEAAPVPVGTGFSADGREQLRFLQGSSPQPLAWSDDAAWEIGGLLRQLHEATAGFEPAAESVWLPWFARGLPGRRPVIGHGDLGPWNVLASDGHPTAFIDWDNAGPVDAIWELAQVVWLNAQLHDEDVVALNDLPDTPVRLNHAALILDGYGIGQRERTGFVDKMIEFAIRAARDEAIQYSVGPETVSPADDGFPTLWGVTWRTRAAAWMIDHRAEIDSRLQRP